MKKKSRSKKAKSRADALNYINGVHAAKSLARQEEGCRVLIDLTDDSAGAAGSLKPPGSAISSQHSIILNQTKPNVSLKSQASTSKMNDGDHDRAPLPEGSKQITKCNPNEFNLSNNEMPSVAKNPVKQTPAYKTPVSQPSPRAAIEQKIIQKAAPIQNNMNWQGIQNKSYFNELPEMYRHTQQPQMYRAGIPKSFLIKEQENYLQNLYKAPDFTKDVPTNEAKSAQAANLLNLDNIPTYTAGEYLTEQAFIGEENVETFAQANQAQDAEELKQIGEKRLSAFQRLGPVTQPKKPKLTINLLFSKEKSVREVVDDDSSHSEPVQEHVPVCQRKEVLASADEIVVKFLSFWPWQPANNKNAHTWKIARSRASKSVMIMEQEEMAEYYERSNVFIKVSISGYPPTATRNEILDFILDKANDKSFVPCFIERTPETLDFLVLNCKIGLIALHKIGLLIRRDDYEMKITLAVTNLQLKNLNFIPRIMLGKRLSMAYNDEEKKLNLSKFCLEDDITHFIFCPLYRVGNQTEIVQLQSAVKWRELVELNLSHNELTTLSGFDIAKSMPKLKHLDLSHNLLKKITALTPCRGVLLRSLKLEGNPLCHNYIDPAHYVKVVRMLFPCVTLLDGVKIPRYGEMPTVKQNYCPQEAKDLVEKFLEVFFPLLDSPASERTAMADLYHTDAIFTATYRYALNHTAVFRRCRELFYRCRILEEGDVDSLVGATNIVKHITKWPPLKHDPLSLTADVLHHDENSTILRVGGIVKVTSESLADDEYLLSFTRTLVLSSNQTGLYRIQNEMLYWDELTQESIRNAFQVTVEKKGVRQGDTISPKLFNALLENVFSSLYWSKYKWRILVTSQIANDIALLSENHDNLQAMLHSLNQASSPSGLYMNPLNTQAMTNGDQKLLWIDAKT